MKVIDNLIGLSLKNELLVILAAILLIGAGLYTSKKIDIDVFPDLTAPTVVIMTEAGGMAPEEIERAVTYPIESVVNGAAGVTRVRSTSSPGASMVWIEFDYGTDIYKARQIISEKMIEIQESLPQGVRPVIAPQSSVMGEILFIGLQSDSTSMANLRSIADWVIKPAILSTGGVSQVTIIGGDYMQYKLKADPIRMQKYGITLSDIIEAGASFGTNSSGGVVREYGNEFLVRGISATSDIEELKNAVVGATTAGPVLLSDVADVVYEPAVKMGHASLNGSAGVIISVAKQPGVNTLELTEKLDNTLAKAALTLPPDVKMNTEIFRQADFIDRSIHNVSSALIEGAIFVIIILFFFLNSYRTTIISVVAIPLSLLGTVIVMHLLGLNINTMTLGGMCIAIGSLVDDAIIDVENVYKRLRQNHTRPVNERLPAIKVVFEASREIRSSVLNATLIIIVAFIPLFFLSGVEGKMLKPLGVAYIISLLMSLIVAMTVTPVLSRILLSSTHYLESNKKEPRFLRALTRFYRNSLHQIMSNPKPLLITTCALFVIALSCCMFLGRGFLPAFNEGAATISVMAPPGVSPEVSDELGRRIEKELLEIPEVRSTARRTGRGELDEHSQATNTAEIDVRFKDSKTSQEKIFEKIREKTASIPGVVITIGQPLGHRIDHIISGTRANIAVKVYGTDLGELQNIGNEIKEIAEKVNGIVDVSVEAQNQAPQLRISAKPNAMARHGVTIAEFNKTVTTLLAQEPIGRVYQGERSYDVVLAIPDRFQNSVEEIGNILVNTTTGTSVPLNDIADIKSVYGPGSISRQNASRNLTVSANVSGRDLSGAAEELQSVLNQNLRLPEGYRLEFGGQFENARSASQTLLIATLGALLVIFLLLYLEFRNIRLSLLILAGLPFALIGGIFAIMLSDRLMSIPAIIGFITLFGVATRNGILLVSRYHRLLSEHPVTDRIELRKAIIEGSSDRLNPILMTALTSALALIPLALGSDKPGNEIQSPMAIVVLGGLLTSTLLNLFIIPIIFEWRTIRSGKA